MSAEGAAAVVCGYDGRRGGRDAVLLGELLARTLATRLDVVTALPAACEPAVLDAELRTALAPSSVAFTATVREGRPGDVLLEAAGSADLLAIGSTHRAGVGRVLPGTTASRLLGAARCPVAIAPRSFGATTEDHGLADGLRVIEVGYDGSAEARAALDRAAALAAAAAATVRVVAVSNPSGIGAQPAGGAAGAYAVASPFDLQQSLHDAVAELPDELRALPIYERGIAANVLVERASEGVDLLVIGSRGHGRVSTALLGSTSKAVVEAAGCPTIVVPRPRQPR